MRSKQGLLILEQQKHLQGFEGQGKRYFGATIFSGQCGRLLGKMRRQEVLHDSTLIDVFAADVGAYDQQRIKSLLEQLEKKGAITIYRDGASIRKIEETMQTEAEILEITHEIWEESNPSDTEQVSRDAIIHCGELPRLKEELDSHLEARGFKKADMQLGTVLTEQFYMLTKVDDIAGIDQPVFHTPVLGNVNIRGAIHHLRGLDDNLKQQVDNTLRRVGEAQGLPVERIKVSSDITNTLHRLGLLNIERVETTGGTRKDFAFTPSLWGRLGLGVQDEQEHVRALLACVQFGRISPTKVDGVPYPIRNPAAYLWALRNRGSVGPSTMIGTDYLILVREGIVKVLPSNTKPGQWDMHLVKEDVAERAHKIVSTGIGADVDMEPRPESLTQYGLFGNSVQTRLESNVETKKRSSLSDYADKELIRFLRGER